jgi:mono/diheme cytochrome c family protein
LLGILLTVPASAPAVEGGVPEASTNLFVSKCSSCHSVGQGARVGPDLKGVADHRQKDWLRQMIQIPSRFLNTDPEARALLGQYNGVRMPDLGLDDAQVDALIELLAYCSANECKLAPELKPVTDATSEDMAHGRALALGTVQLENGGPPCISCHTAEGMGAAISGGTLAKDLTNTFARLGDEGLDASLRNPAFPVMNRVFTDHPVTADEAFALRAFLYDANRSTPGEQASMGLLSVPVAGVVGAIVVLLLLNAAWSRRLRGIRKPLVGQGRQSS